MYAFMYFANFVQPNICHFSQDPEVGMVVKAKQAAAIDQPINDQQQDAPEPQVKEAFKENEVGSLKVTSFYTN